MFLRRFKFATHLCLFAVLFNSIAPAYAISGHKSPQSYAITYKELYEALEKDLEVKRAVGQEKKSEHVESISQEDKRKLCCDVLSKSEKYTSSFSNEKSAQGLRNLHHDIELFKVVFPRIDRTSTVFGQALLAKMLSTPFVEIETLQKRQELIELLVQDEALFNELQGLVERVKHSESALLSYWQDEDATTKELIKSFYFNTIFTQRFNQTARGLEVAARWNIALAMWPLVSDIVYSAMFKYAFDAKVARVDISIIEALTRAFNDTYNPFAIYQDYLDYKAGKYNDYFERVYSSVKDKYGKTAAELARDGMGELKWAQIAMTPLNIWLKLQNIKSVNENIVLRNNVLYKIQARLIGFSTLIDVMEQINEIVDCEPAFEQGLITIKNLDTLQKPLKVSKDFKLLVNTLKTETFKGEPSLCSYIGRVLLAHRHMKKYKNNFAGILETLGEIDACLSIAHLIKEYKNERVHYSFVRYVQAEKPYLKLNNFWNPMVNHAVVVPNSIELGAPNSMQSMILTGSNTGGKSTLLKAMLINALLAQTLCIGPADDIAMTPFVYLGSSLNIVDNTQGGQSLYQAEVDRASSLMNATDFFKGIGYCFLVIDELFRGTGPEKAEQETINCARAMISKENTAFVLATHYKKHVMMLETESLGLCKNYKIEAYIDADGTIVRPRLLQEGISTSDIADALLGNAMRDGRK